MEDFVSASALILDSIGVWVAFIVTLMIFSSLAGDNAVSRMAQHILIGAGLGYAGVLAIRHVLIPRLINPLQSGEASLTATWIPMALAFVLLMAGVDRILLQSADRAEPLPGWRRWLQVTGRLVVALLLGIGFGAGIIGALQGTLVPQYVRAAQIGIANNTSISGPLLGIFTLLLTTATLLHLFVRPDRHLVHQPRTVRTFMRGWLWIGQRALWFTSGLIFARLVASRLSLLIARISFLTEVIQ